MREELGILYVFCVLFVHILWQWLRVVWQMGYNGELSWTKGWNKGLTFRKEAKPLSSTPPLSPTSRPLPHPDCHWSTSSSSPQTPILPLHPHDIPTSTTTILPSSHSFQVLQPLPPHPTHIHTYYIAKFSCNMWRFQLNYSWLHYTHWCHLLKVICVILRAVWNV